MDDEGWQNDWDIVDEVEVRVRDLAQDFEK